MTPNGIIAPVTEFDHLNGRGKSRLEEYYEFLARKVDVATWSGFEVSPEELHPALKPHQRDAVIWSLKMGRGLIAKRFGLGKCHGAGTKILMADGTIKNVEDVKAGDQLMGDDSTPRNVLSLARGREEMYRITLKNGDSYTCNASHILALKVSLPYAGLQYGDVINISVRDYLKLPPITQNRLKHFKVAVDFEEQPVPFDPYLYGAWLGDGHRNSLTWTINDIDTEIVNCIREFAGQHNLAVAEKQERGRCTTYGITRKVRGRAVHCDEFYFVKSSVDNDGAKRIDPSYLKNSRDVRLQVLAGLLDTDGYLIDKCYEITTKWEGLRDDILFLARSLGLSVTHKPKIVNGITYYRIWISGDTHLIPCITRKKAEVRQQIKNPLVYGFNIEPLNEGDYYGFEIDGNHHYLLGDFTVTHNTITQCEIARQVVSRFGGKFLQVCPLGAKHVFQYDDGPRLGMTYKYVTSDEEIEAADTPYLITNYERVRDGGINPKLHNITGMSLDEGDILRLLDSKTFWVFMDVCANVPYKWAASATPNPQNTRELIYFAHWLGVADYGQLLTKYFMRNPDKAGDLQLMEHQAEKFWIWVASWALFLYAPSDLGYDDTGYTLPEVRIHWHKVEVDHSRAWDQIDSRGQRRMFLNAAGGVSEAAAEKRATLPDRIEKMLEIMRDYDPQKAGKKTKGWLLWHDLEDERRAIEKAVPGVVSVYGSQKMEVNEERVTGFSQGKYTHLAGKPEMIGSGPNFQYFCADAIFLGVGYKFKDFIQALHRIVRYLQKEIVDIHIIYAESEEGIVTTLRERWRNFDEQTERMRQIIRAHGLTHRALEANLKRTMGVNRQETRGHLFSSILNDCVVELLELADMLDAGDWQGLNSRIGHLVGEVTAENFEQLTQGFFDMLLTSIPFGQHFEYSEQYEDFGHNVSDLVFWEQMDFLIPVLLRLTRPGRIGYIHVKDRVMYAHQTTSGFMEISEFSDDCVKAFKKHGWLYEGRRTVVTDVVRENSSTYRLGWSECCKDSSKMGSGLPEYILLFRKPPTDRTNSYADTKVSKDKYRILTCANCDHELDKGLFSELDKNLYGLCPECGERTRFNVVEYGYSRGRWQYDASPFWPSSGNRLLAPSEAFDYEAHVARMEAKERNGNLPADHFHEPPQSNSEWVLTDVNFMTGLNSYQSQKRTEKHLCPLPFDIVDRGIVLYSNPGDLILEPFAGLGTVGYRAVLKGRKAYMCELHPPYWTTNVKYCQDAEIKAMAPTLFDLLEYEQAPEVNGLEAWLERYYPALLDEYRGKATVPQLEPVNGKVK